MSQIGGAYVTSVPAVPVGSLQAYAGSSAPTGWLLCDGSAVSRTTYSNLYSTIGTTFGSGDGSTTFNVPDMRGRHPIGAGTGVGQGVSGSGAPSGTALTARTLGAFGGDERLQAHAHSLYGFDGVSYGAGAIGLMRNLFGSSVTGAHDQSQGSGQNMSPYVVTNYIIKAIPDTPRGGMTATYTPPIVTTIPASPQFGDQVIYAADATNGVYWHLQYDATGTYPWKFIGGPPLFSGPIGGTQWGVNEGTSSLNHTTLATAGPAITVPLPGDYDAQGSASFVNNATDALGSVLISYTGLGTLGWSFGDFINYGATVYQAVTGGATKRITGRAANDVIQLLYATSNVSYPQYFYNRRLAVTPVRVKAA